MLIYNPKPSLSGTPTKEPQPDQAVKDAQTAMQSGLEAAKAKAQTKASTDAVTELLPHKDGSKVLYAQEVAADQPSQEAAAKLAKLMTPQVLTAIPKVALAKYLTGLAPLVDKDKAKALFHLSQFVARLRVWPILNSIYLLATNDRDTYTVGQDQNLKSVVIDPLMAQVQTLTDAAAAMLPADSQESGDQPHKALAQMVKLVQDVKKAQADLWKVQTKGTPVKFKLYELKIGTGNVESTTWQGPVAVNPRVADAAGNYPIPNIWWPKDTGAFQNMVYVGELLGLADLLPYSFYNYNGSSIYPNSLDNNYSVSWEGSITVGEATKSPISQALYEVVTDQFARLGVKPPPQPADPLLSGYALTTLDQMVDAGLQHDPEWGGKVSSLTVKQVLDNSVLPSIKAQQATFRSKLKAPAAWGPAADSAVPAAWTTYKDAVSKLKSAVLNVSFVVPTEWKWELTGGAEFELTGKATFYQPTTPDWDKWLADVSIDDPLHNNLYKLIEKNYSYFMKLKADPEIVGNLYSTIIALLQDAALDKPQQPFGQWVPSATSPLPPVPFLSSYNLDKLLSLATPPSLANSDASLGGLTIDQVSIVNVRATMKSATLLAMKASEFGVESQEVTDSILATLMDLCQKLYGCTPTPWPPDPSSKLEDLVDYYKKQLADCMQNPAPNSMSAMLANLLAQYKDLKAKADAGDSDAQTQLDKIAEQISELTAKMAELAGVIASLLKDVVDNTVGSNGGTLDWINLSDGFLAGIDLAGKIKFSDGVDANLGQTPEETQAQQDVKDQNAKTKLAALQSLALVQITTDTFKNFVGVLHIPVADVVIENATASGSVADTYVPDPPEKKPNWWWLLLVAAAVAAKNK